MLYRGTAGIRPRKAPVTHSVPPLLCRTGGRLGTALVKRAADVFVDGRTRPRANPCCLAKQKAGPHRASRTTSRRWMGDSWPLVQRCASASTKEPSGEMSETYAWSYQSRSVNSRAAIP